MVRKLLLALALLTLLVVVAVILKPGLILWTENEQAVIRMAIQDQIWYSEGKAAEKFKPNDFLIRASRVPPGGFFANWIIHFSHKRTGHSFCIEYVNTVPYGGFHEIACPP